MELPEISEFKVGSTKDKILSPLSKYYRGKSTISAQSVAIQAVFPFVTVSRDAKIALVKNSKSGCTSLAKSIYTYDTGADFDGNIHRSGGYLAQECAASWVQKNPSYEVRRLCANGIEGLIDLTPELRTLLASRIVQRKRGGVVARYNRIEGNALEAFLGRPDGKWPIAEHFLTTNLDDIADPFVFQDYSKNAWLHALYKVESRLWRMAKPVLKLLK